MSEFTIRKKGEVILSQKIHKESKYKDPMYFDRFSIVVNPEDDSCHIVAGFRGRSVGGEVKIMDDNQGYTAGRFRLYRNDWPNLCKFIDVFWRSVAFPYINQILRIEITKDYPRKLTDEEFFTIMETNLKERTEALEEAVEMFNKRIKQAKDNKKKAKVRYLRDLE